MAIKVTFTLDEETVARLARAAARAKRPKSAVVREAIRQYEASGQRLGEDERRSLLAAVASIAGRGPTRPQREVEAELRRLRAERHSGGRRHPSA